MMIDRLGRFVAALLLLVAALQLARCGVEALDGIAAVVAG